MRRKFIKNLDDKIILGAFLYVVKFGDVCRIIQKNQPDATITVY